MSNHCLNREFKDLIRDIWKDNKTISETSGIGMLDQWVTYNLDIPALETFMQTVSVDNYRGWT